MECRDKILSEEYVDFLVRVRNFENIRNQYQDICYEEVNDEWIVAYVPVREVAPLGFGKYGYYPIPKLYGTMDQSNMVEAGIIRAQNQRNLELTGRDVIVGIIDDEIDYLHEVFRDEAGNTRFLAIWNQGSNEGDLPEDVGYGSEYTSDSINEAIRSDEPYLVVPDLSASGGHGTFVAGIAAGSPVAGEFIGAAPDAEIAFVKLRPAKAVLRDFYLINEAVGAYSESDIMLGVKYLVNLAIRQNKPLVICIGVGTSYGPHTMGTPLAQLLSEVSDTARNAVVLPMGNEGNARHHFLGIVPSNGEYDNVEIRVGENERGFLLELWGQQPDNFSVGIVAPSGERISPIQSALNVSRRIDFVYENTVIYADYKLIENINGSQLITLRFEAPSPGIWQIRVYSDASLSGYFNMWLPVGDFLSSDTYFLRPSPYITLTQPASAMNPISVGAYNHENNSIWIDSGRGYTANGGVKPDIVAPGVNVFGPRSGGNHSQFTRKTGTSIAAAHGAGAAAQMFQWRNQNVLSSTLRTQNIKAIMIIGAKRDETRIYPNPEWGYGRLDVAASFDKLAGL